MQEADTWLTRREAPEITAVRARLAVARHHTQAAIGSLRSELATQTDWHVWFRARPYPFLAAAFVAGFLLARRR